MTEQEMTELLTAMLIGMPGVSSMNYGKRANFMIGGKKKIFAFTRKNGVALKPYENAAAMKQDLKLLKEAMAFTEAKG